MVTYRDEEGSVVEKYEGTWFEGRMHGTGKYTYADGGVYEGTRGDTRGRGAR